MWQPHLLLLDTNIHTYMHTYFSEYYPLCIRFSVFVLLFVCLFVVQTECVKVAVVYWLACLTVAQEKSQDRACTADKFCIHCLDWLRRPSSTSTSRMGNNTNIQVQINITISQQTVCTELCTSTVTLSEVVWLRHVQFNNQSCSYILVLKSIKFRAPLHHFRYSGDTTKKVR